jgi:Rrf2 family protein
MAIINALGELMKLSRASGYALQAIVGMAAGQSGVPVASQLTAEAEGIPERFLLKLLFPLVKANILLSRKGPRGGYFLAKPPAKITLLEIIEAVDGPLGGLPLRIGGKGTDALDKRVAEICQKVSEETRRQLGKVTVADLAKKGIGKK